MNTLRKGIIIKKMGRLVHTHSTYIIGLIEILKKLAKEDGIDTISPGVIARVKGHTEKIKITITREILGGYKLNVRKGRSAQEVYITTKYSRNELIGKIIRCSESIKL